MLGPLSLAPIRSIVPPILVWHRKELQGDPLRRFRWARDRQLCVAWTKALTSGDIYVGGGMSADRGAIVEFAEIVFSSWDRLWVGVC